MGEDDVVRRLREVTERFLRHEAAWSELWHTFCGGGAYTEEFPEGVLSPSLEKFWDEVYDLVYMSIPGVPPAGDRAVGVIGEDELRMLLAARMGGVDHEP